MKKLSNQSQALSEHEHKTLEHLSEFKDQFASFESRLQSTGEDLPDSEFDPLRSQLRQVLFQLEDAARKSQLDEQSRSNFFRTVHRELSPYLLLSDNARRWYEKPRGFSGDYLTMKNLYSRITGGRGRTGRALDEALIDLPPVKSVRNRRRFLGNQLIHTINTSGNPFPSITSLACGAAVEVFDVIEEMVAPPVQFNLLDMDSEAIDYLEKKIAQGNMTDRITTYRRNLVYLIKGRHTLDIGPQDLIYTAGLIDYFEDDFVVELMNWIHGKLDVGGRTILGNFHPRNPNRVFMDEILDWELVHRTEKEMNRLAKASKFDRSFNNVWFEENKINLFAECVKE